jgi:hypothetical protein
MELFLHYLELFAQIIGGVCIAASVVVRITPSKKDDEIVNKTVAFFYKLLHFLPTIGVNPQTKKIKEHLDALKK